VQREPQLTEGLTEFGAADL